MASSGLKGEELGGCLKFECGICLKEFSTAWFLQVHIKTHDEKQSFDCHECGMMFQNFAELWEHMKQHIVGEEFVPAEENSEVCSVCGKDYPVSQIAMHQRSHIFKLGLTCTTCGKSFGSSQVLKLHLRTHGKKMLYQCQICGLKFASRNSFMFHWSSHGTSESPDSHSMKYRSKHKSEISKGSSPPVNMFSRHKKSNNCYKCNICPKPLSTSTKLEVHSLCNQSQTDQKSKKNSAAARHIKKREIIDRNRSPFFGFVKKLGKYFFCSVCRKDFKAKSKAEKHARYHYYQEREKNHTEEFSEHFEARRRRGRPHLTDEPGKFGIKQNTRKQYTGIGDNDTELCSTEDTLTCSECNKTFNKVDDIQQHRQLHVKEYTLALMRVLSSKKDINFALEPETVIDAVLSAAKNKGQQKQGKTEARTKFHPEEAVPMVAPEYCDLDTDDENADFEVEHFNEEHQNGSFVSLPDIFASPDNSQDDRTKKSGSMVSSEDYSQNKEPCSVEVHKHIMKETHDQITCKVCNKEFSSFEQVSVHIKSHLKKDDTVFHPKDFHDLEKMINVKVVLERFDMNQLGIFSRNGESHLDRLHSLRNKESDLLSVTDSATLQRDSTSGSGDISLASKYPTFGIPSPSDHETDNSCVTHLDGSGDDLDGFEDNSSGLVAQDEDRSPFKTVRPDSLKRKLESMEAKFDSSDSETSSVDADDQANAVAAAIRTCDVDEDEEHDLTDLDTERRTDSNSLIVLDSESNQVCISPMPKLPNPLTNAVAIVTSTGKLSDDRAENEKSKDVQSYYSKDGDIYSCSICSREFFCESKICEHVQNHFKEKKFKCGYCGHSFNDRTKLLFHEHVHEKQHAEAGGVTSEDVKTIQDKFFKDNNVFKCRLCTRVYRLGKDIYHHVLNHLFPIKHPDTGVDGSPTDESPQVPGSKQIGDHKNQIGSKKFTNRDATKFIVAEEGMFKCIKCQQKTKSLPSAKAHVKRHFIAASCKCSLCPYVTYTKHRLNVHTKTHSKLKKKYPEWINAADSGEGSSKTFSFKDASSFIVEENGEVRCTICNGIFSSKATAKAHVVRHKQPPRFECPLCDFRHFTRHHLNRHVLTVHKGKTKTCNKKGTGNNDGTNHDFDSLSKGKYSSTAPGTTPTPLTHHDDETAVPSSFSGTVIPTAVNKLISISKSISKSDTLTYNNAGGSGDPESTDIKGPESDIDVHVETSKTNDNRESNDFLDMESDGNADAAETENAESPVSAGTAAILPQRSLFDDFPLDKLSQRIKEKISKHGSHYYCGICSKKFALKKKVHDHVRYHFRKTLSEKKMCKCEYCGHLSANEIVNVQHEMYHLKQHEKISCVTDQEMKTLKDKFVEHNGIFDCLICDVNYKCRRTIYKHVLNHLIFDNLGKATETKQSLEKTSETFGLGDHKPLPLDDSLGTSSQKSKSAASVSKETNAKKVKPSAPSVGHDACIQDSKENVSVLSLKDNQTSHIDLAEPILEIHSTPTLVDSSEYVESGVGSYERNVQNNSELSYLGDESNKEENIKKNSFLTCADKIPVNNETDLKKRINTSESSGGSHSVKTERTAKRYSTDKGTRNAICVENEVSMIRTDGKHGQDSVDHSEDMEEGSVSDTSNYRLRTREKTASTVGKEPITFSDEEPDFDENLTDDEGDSDYKCDSETDESDMEEEVQGGVTSHQTGNDQNHETEKVATKIQSSNESKTIEDPKLDPKKEQRLHHSDQKQGDTMEIYACELCNKQFLTSERMQFHKFIHQALEEIGMNIKDVHESTNLPQSLSCPKCKKQYPSMKKFKSHIRIHTDEKKYKCEICGLAVASRTYFLTHQNIHNNKQPFKCKFCPRKFHGHNAVQDHMKRNHLKEWAKQKNLPELEGFADCKGNSDFKEIKQKHPIHKGMIKVDGKYCCKICQKKFERQVRCVTHVANHLKKRTYTCDVCGNTTVSKAHLNIHMNNHENKMNCFPCRICHHELPQLSLLRDHMALHSDEDKIKHLNYVKCETCGTACKSSKALYRHHLEHLDTFQCKYCDVILPSAVAFENHAYEKGHFQCEQCGKIYSEPKSLFKHKANGHGNVKRSFKCDKCGKHFLTIECLKQHVQTHSQKYTCKICKASFKMFEELENHKLDKKHEVTVGENECEICSRRFLLSSQLKYHKLIHQALAAVGEDDECGNFPSKLSVVLSCPVCKKDYPSLPKLRDHIRVHTDEKKFKCDVCGTAFAYRSLLQTHQYIHASKRPFQCEHCPRAFGHKHQLKRHVKERHGKKEITFITCKICGKNVKERYMKSHIRIHDKVKHIKQHSCDLCDKKFYSMHQLRAHKTMHSNTASFMCDVCGMLFRNKYILKGHEKVHTGERPFQCSECGNTFKSKETLKKHFLVHSGEKAYKCEFCDKAFGLPETLRDHRYIHTGEKPYKCDLCGEGFKDRWARIRHRKMHGMS